MSKISLVDLKLETYGMTIWIYVGAQAQIIVLARRITKELNKQLVYSPHVKEGHVYIMK